MATGVNAFEVMGVICRRGSHSAVGYVARLSGLADSRLFRSGEPHGGDGARHLPGVGADDRPLRAAEPFAVTALGTVRFFFAAAGGADFAAPATFADGTRIGTFDARLHNVLTVIGPDQAITTVDGELRQRQVAGFSLAGRRYRLGRQGLALRLQVSGPGTRTEPTTPRATFNVAGSLVVAG